MDAEVLVSWSVSARVPRVLGPKRRLREAIARGPEHEGASGHAEVTGDAGASSIGPRDAASGHANGPREEAAGEWVTARHRMRDLVERARRYADALRAEPELTQGELGARERVSGARVNQVLSILRLEEAILADLTDVEHDAPVPALDDLFAVGRIADGRKQVARYRALCEALAGERRGIKARQTRQRGFRHLLAKARALQDALDSGAHRSMAALARAEGLSPRRVGQLLDLVCLAPEIVAAIEVDPERLPDGLTQQEVRQIAKLGSPDEQVEAFFGRWPQLRGGVAAK